MNSIDMRVEFSFKGETYDLRSRLELDTHLSRYGHLPDDLYELMAIEHQIDPISYLYEVMQVEQILFSNPQGFAADFLHGDDFDLDGFAAHWHKHQITLLVSPIAKRYLGIDDLEQQPALRDALVQAYRLGSEA